MSKKTGIIAAVVALVVVAVGVGSYYLDGDDILGAMKRKARFARRTPISRTIATPKPAYNESQKDTRRAKKSTAGIYSASQPTEEEEETPPDPYTGPVDPPDPVFTGDNVSIGMVIHTAARFRELILGDGIWDKSYPDCPIQAASLTAEQKSFCYLYDHGKINSGVPDLPYAQYFDLNANRAEAAKWFAEVLEYPTYSPAAPTYPDLVANAWYFQFVETLAHEGITDDSPQGLFLPSEFLTMDSLDIWYHNIQNNLPEIDYTEVTLEVSLSNDTPDGVVLASGITSVPVATWDFEANGSDIELEELIVSTYGITTLPTDHVVYLYEGDTQLTYGESVSNSTNEATFKDLNLSIDEGDALSLTLRLDTGSASFASVAAFELESADAVEAISSVDNEGTEVEGDFPLQGEIFTISTFQAGSSMVSLSSDSPFGTQAAVSNQTILKFVVSVSDAEDIVIDSLTMKCLNQNPDNAIQGEALRLYSQGTLLETMYTPSDWCETGVKMPLDFEIEKGESRGFEVRYNTTSFDQHPLTDEAYMFILDDLEVVYQASGVVKSAEGVPVEGNILQY